ncbi:hypothetical protein QJS66_19365 [Kocuria rhizophila]|nr:hypothetical protein QJS66_19365 [Kocuria rhizophila]
MDPGGGGDHRAQLRRHHRAPASGSAEFTGKPGVTNATCLIPRMGVTAVAAALTTTRCAPPVPAAAAPTALVALAAVIPPSQLDTWPGR